LQPYCFQKEQGEQLTAQGLRSAVSKAQRGFHRERAWRESRLQTRKQICLLSSRKSTVGCPLLPAILQAAKELFLLPFFSLFLALGAEASPKCSSYAVDLADADAQIKTLLECGLNA